ncbi:Do family serine endopeptidase [Silvibacterium acidisoli]|uniref:Do family serine endopeptidase n=1 Tax=Acidobacteriaceae bacterium ZG23-2 TaxID=2883246 RepID=UPI00406CF1F3
MNESTNQLVARAKKYALPAVLAASLVAGGASYFHHSAAVMAAGNGAAPLPDSSVSSLTALDDAVEAVAAKVTPAVVNVAVTAKATPGDGQEDDQQDGQQGEQQQQLPPGFAQFFGPQGPMMRPQQPQIEHGIGSGIIISPDGYIVTNNHVVNGAMQIRVTLHDRRVLNAKVVGVDKLTDLAVIKVDANNLPSIAWGDSTLLKPGQTVLAFGSPFGYFQFSVTRGIISALNRPNPFSNDPRKPGGYIQTDAAINPGNSGGPLVNAHGELIGINTWIISSGSDSFAGAGFAIPVQIVRSTAESIIKTGAAHHGYLGISMNDVSPENASFFNLKDADGAIVAQVTPDSPAGTAGVERGDVIRKLNGEPIINSSALQVAVSQIAPGTSITLGILRNGSEKTVNVKVGEYHANTEVAKNGDGPSQRGKLGLAVANITPDVRQQLNLPDQVHGVAIQNVRPGSPAEDAGLSPGDVIEEVDRKPTTSAQDFVDKVHGSPSGKDLLLLVWSQGGSSYRIIHPENNNNNNGSGDQDGM